MRLVNTKRNTKTFVKAYGPVIVIEQKDLDYHNSKDMIELKKDFSFIQDVNYIAKVASSHAYKDGEKYNFLITKNKDLNFIIDNFVLAVSNDDYDYIDEITDVIDKYINLRYSAYYEFLERFKRASSRLRDNRVYREGDIDAKLGI